MAPRGVLITRPEPAAQDTASRVAALGFVPILAPMLAIVALPVRLPPVALLQAILLTSGNAAAALGTADPALRSVPVLAVGDATAARARSVGFAQVASAAGDATALATLVAARCDPAGGALLLATAPGQGLPLAQALRRSGFRVFRRTVYAARPAAVLPAAAMAALRARQVAAVLVFSPATALILARLLRDALPDKTVFAGIAAYAISPAAAAPLRSLGWRLVRSAVAPTQDALLQLLCDDVA